MKSFRDFGIDVSDNFDGERLAICPQCSPNRKKKNVKCLSVNGSIKVWVCHHCDWRGTLKGGVDQPSVRRKTYLKPTYRVPATTQERPSGLPGKLVDWFAKRGITESVLQRNKIGCGSIYMPQAEEEVFTIQFPYYRDGEIINIKYRDVDKNFRLASGAELILYGLDDIEKTLIIVEGEIDKLSVEVAGHISVVSVPNGAPAIDTKNYEQAFQYLESAVPKLEKVTKFIIAVDNDPPGHKLEAELIRRLGVEKCFRTTWPEGCKDANEVLQKHGVDALKLAIDAAEPVPVSGWIELDREAFLQLCIEGRPSGVHPGWDALAPYYTVKSGDWTVITGIPQSGKSTWLDALLVNLAAKHDWEFAIFSPEMSPFEDHAIILAEQLTGCSVKRLPIPKRESSYWWIKDHFHAIEPDDSPTLDKVLQIARLMVLRRGIKGLVIDPWNELEHNRGGLSETDHISICLAKIRKFAQQNDIHIWIVAHPTKVHPTSSNNGKHVYPVPSPYDISGSANWRNKADCCLTVWRDQSEDINRVQLHIQKIRRKEVGKLGMVEFHYEHSNNRFYELTEREEPLEFGEIEISDKYIQEEEYDF